MRLVINKFGPKLTYFSPNKHILPPFPKITDAPHFQGFGNMVDILKNIFYIFQLDVNFIQIKPLKTILWTKNSSLVKQIPDGHHF